MHLTESANEKWGNCKEPLHKGRAFAPQQMKLPPSLSGSAAKGGAEPKTAQFPYNIIQTRSHARADQMLFSLNFKMFGPPKCRFGFTAGGW
jgi:hypothetical protein